MPARYRLSFLSQDRPGGYICAGCSTRRPIPTVTPISGRYRNWGVLDRFRITRYRICRRTPIKAQKSMIILLFGEDIHHLNHFGKSRTALFQRISCLTVSGRSVARTFATAHQKTDQCIGAEEPPFCPQGLNSSFDHPALSISS